MLPEFTLRRLGLLSLAIGTAAAGALQANVVQLEHATVCADTGRYHMSSAVTVPVPETAVRAVPTRCERNSGDFREGWVLYRISARADGRTRVAVDAHLVPEVPLPSLIGETLMRHRLESQAMLLAVRVVEAASGSAPARLHTPRFRLIEHTQR